MSMFNILMATCGIALIYIAVLLGLMAWMANNAAKKYPATVCTIPPQEGILEKVREFAQGFAYKERPEDAQDNDHVFRKGRGWLTSLTDLHLHLQDDGGATIEVKEGVNFLVKMLYFPINAGTFLGLPVRQRKVKHLNLLLQSLHAAPIEFGQGKRVKIKKHRV